MGAVSGAERVVHVDVGERRERPCEVGLVGGLAAFVANVLEHEDLPGVQPLGEHLRRAADDVVGECDLPAGELAQAIGDRAHRQLGLAVAGAPEMRHEHDRRAPGAQLLDRGERRAYAGVVGHADRPASRMLERDVEIGAQQHTPAGEVEIVECSQTPEISFAACFRRGPRSSTSRFTV